MLFAKVGTVPLESSTSHPEVGLGQLGPSCRWLISAPGRCPRSNCPSSVLLRAEAESQPFHLTTCASPEAMKHLHSGNRPIFNSNLNTLPLGRPVKSRKAKSGKANYPEGTRPSPNRTKLVSRVNFLIVPYSSCCLQRAGRGPGPGTSCLHSYFILP